MVKIIEQINSYMILTSSLFLVVWCTASLFFTTVIPVNILIIASLLSLSFYTIKLKLNHEEYEYLEKILYTFLTFMIIACITYKVSFWALRGDIHVKIIHLLGKTAWLAMSILGIISLVFDNGFICYLKFKPLMLFKKTHFLSYIILLTILFFGIGLFQNLQILIPWSSRPLFLIFSGAIVALSYLIFQEPIRKVFRNAIRFSNYIEVGIYSLFIDSSTLNDSLKDAIETNDSTTTAILSRFANFDNTKKGLILGIDNSNYHYVEIFSETRQCSPELINLSLKYAIEKNRRWAIRTIGESKKATSMNIKTAIDYAISINKQDTVKHLIKSPKLNEELIEQLIRLAITMKNVNAVDIILKSQNASKIKMENILTFACSQFSEEIMDRLLNDDKITESDLAIFLDYATKHNEQNVINKIKKSKKITNRITEKSESVFVKSIETKNHTP